MYYWPLDNLNISIQNVQSIRKDRKENSTNLRNPEEYGRVTINKGLREFKTNKEGLLFNECTTEQGVVNQSLMTDGKSAWVNLGPFINTCVSDPSLCPNGFTVALWMKYEILDANGLQYFMGTSGNRDGLKGFLIYQDFPYDKEDHLAIKVENGTVLWKRSFSVPRSNWTHVTFTWDEREGLVIYSNGSNVGGDPKGKTTKLERNYFTMFTLGRPNNVYAFSKAAYDELAVWERKLHPREIEAIYQRTAGIGITPDLEEGVFRLLSVVLTPRVKFVTLPSSSDTRPCKIIRRVFLLHQYDNLHLSSLLSSTTCFLDLVSALHTVTCQSVLEV